MLQGAAHADDGHNVVIHEFAHQIDQEAGGALADAHPELFREFAQYYATDPLSWH